MTQVFVLSEEAEAFRDAAVHMPMIEDIYSISDRRAWFVVYTDAQRETRVASKLEEKQIDVFLPQTTEWKPRTRAERDMKKPLEPISKPLLTRYLFVSLPVAEQRTPFGLVRNTDGVREILGNQEKPLPVPASFVEFLKEQEEAGAFNRTEKRGRVVAPKWAKEGVTVEVKAGPFTGLLGIVRKCLPRNQVEVAMKIFGRETFAKMGMVGVRHLPEFDP